MSRWVRNESIEYLFNRIAHPDINGRSSIHLWAGREQHHLVVCYFVEFGVALVIRVHKVLDFGHREFPEDEEQDVTNKTKYEKATNLIQIKYPKSTI